MSGLRVALVADPSSAHTRVWLGGLLEAGHEVRLFSPHKQIPPDDLGVSCRAPLARRAASSETRAAAADTKVGASASLELRTITRALRLAPALRAWLRAYAPDRLIALRLQPEAYLAALGGTHPFGVVAWGQDVLRFAFAHALHRTYSRQVVRSADRLWGETGAVLAGLAQLGATPTKLGQAYTGIDLEFWHRPSPSTIEDAMARLAVRHPEWRDWWIAREAGVSLVFSPRAVAREGHQRELLRAIARDDTTRLLLAGSGDPAERVHLAAEARSLGVSERVHDLGLLSPAELRVVYWRADLVASLWSPDGLSQTMLEAMAAGAVVLAADLPGNGAWITAGVNGHLVDPRDVDAITRALRAALEDRSPRATEHNRGLLASRADRRINLARWVREVEEMG
ncbi:MAG: glycosyltransferase [Candidatus Eisenbacteria bacterium]